MKKQKGMTLLELSVVILVLSSLVAILFAGAHHWSKNEGERKCFAQQLKFHEALLRYRSEHNLKEGDSFSFEMVLASQGINPKEFACPEGGTYTFKSTIQPWGKRHIWCSIPKHIPRGAE